MSDEISRVMVAISSRTDTDNPESVRKVIELIQSIRECVASTRDPYIQFAGLVGALEITARAYIVSAGDGSLAKLDVIGKALLDDISVNVHSVTTQADMPADVDWTEPGMKKGE